MEGWRMTLTVGSLFSGIGGLDLGLERAGMTVKWQSEIDPYACKVLTKHWPKVVNHGDIKLIDWSRVEPVDVVCGGYPCQPFSTAGKRNGTDDPRHLWPWVKRAISELRPRYALMENVRGHLSLGFADVLADLTAIGYDAEWRVISAASVGANHRRERVFIVAYPDGKRLERPWPEQQTTRTIGSGKKMADTDHARERTPECNIDEHGSPIGGEWNEFSRTQFGGFGTDVADTDSERLKKSLRQSEGIFSSGNVGRISTEQGSINGWWQIEPDVGRVADGIPSRVDRLRCLGNAVVPQVAEIVGRLIINADND